MLEIKGNLVHPTAVVEWDFVDIGTGNYIGPFCCIGTPAQHIREESSGRVQIGNNNIFREYTTVHLPTVKDKTTIGNDCFFMVGSHIAHDCIIEDDVRISNYTQLSGNVTIMKGSVLGLGCLVHQGQTIGSFCMLGMGAVVTKKLECRPGSVIVGSPAKITGNNNVGLERNSVTQDILDKEIHRFLEYIK